MRLEVRAGRPLPRKRHLSSGSRLKFWKLVFVGILFTIKFNCGSGTVSFVVVATVVIVLNGYGAVVIIIIIMLNENVGTAHPQWCVL